MSLQQHIDSAYKFGKSVAKAPAAYHDIGMIAPEITAAEEELFPLESMPSQATNWAAFEEWEHRRLNIGYQIWNAYAVGVQDGMQENS